MRTYKLVYDRPYEFDEDSPSGIGDHQIGYRTRETIFEARIDAEARQKVKKFLTEGGYNFGSHPGSISPGLYPRRFVSLHQVTESRRIRF